MSSFLTETHCPYDQLPADPERDELEHLHGTNRRRFCTSPMENIRIAGAIFFLARESKEQ